MAIIILEPNYVMRECATKKKRDFCHKVPAIPGFMSEHELCLKTCYHSECNYEPVDDKLSHFVRRMLHLQPVAENAVHTYWLNGNWWKSCDLVDPVGR